MLVEVKLFATYRQGRFKEKMMEVAEGAVLGDIVESLDLSGKHGRILLVNGLAASCDRKLKNGDVVAIFPQIAGG
jgi:molybdopterin converting factor small subunit